MNSRTFILAFGLLALSTLGWAMTFTGKSNIDFSPTNPNLSDREKASLHSFTRTNRVKCNGWQAGYSDPSNKYADQQPVTRPSGIDMDSIDMMYDDVNDRLYVGIRCAGICGDTDGDGNPSGTDPEAAKAGATLLSDVAGMCESEVFSWEIWNQPPTNYNPAKASVADFYPNIIVGLRTEDCLVTPAGEAGLWAYEFDRGGCDEPNLGLPFNDPDQTLGCEDAGLAAASTNKGFGRRLDSEDFGLPALVIDHAKSLYLNSTYPHIEFYLPGFSQYPYFTPGENPGARWVPAKETKAGQSHFKIAVQGLGAAADACGEDVVLPDLWEIKWDCKGYPNGHAEYDICHKCGGDGTSCLDCEGTPFGTVEYDDYGVCGGNNTADCEGNPYGNKKYDRCHVCGGNDACVDCLNVPFGGAVVDKYGVCDGHDYADCESNPFGSKVYDDCGICGGDGSSCACLHYLGYDLADVDYALLRWTVQASLIKINDTLEVLEAIRAKLATTEYKTGSAASFVDYIDVLHDFCDDCLDSFDSAQIWFASYLSEACDGIKCAPTPLSGTEWTL